MNTDIREQLLQFYLAGVSRVRGYEAVKQFFSEYAMPEATSMVAVGKAATSMALGALEAGGENITDGLVITKHKHLDKRLTSDSRLQCMESDHPLPKENTLSAGRALLKYLHQRVRADAQFLFLLSGGASSLVEVLPDGMNLDDLQGLNASLLASGLDIGQMNRARCALSQIKGGRLAGYLADCEVLNLLISDVPGDDPKVVGSGLLTPNDDVLDLSEYPESVVRLLERFPPASPSSASTFDRIQTHIIACLDDAKQAVAESAMASGYETLVVPEFLAGDIAAAAQSIYSTLRETQGKVVIWGGETTVTLPDKPGRGGRNQHLALALAQLIRKSEKDMYVLCAGTDGTDGATDDAGGLVDSETLLRGEAKGMDAQRYLQNADSGTYLAAVGDLVTTGPTGTNVMDLVIGITV